MTLQPPADPYQGPDDPFIAVHELDSPFLPAPVLRWQELVCRDTTVVHDHDAEKIIPFPRPPWADPNCDIVGASVARCYYASEFADVPLTYIDGVVSGAQFHAASVMVRAKLSGAGLRLIGLSTDGTVDGKWKCSPIAALTPAEAYELAHVLLAAVDLIGGTEL